MEFATDNILRVFLVLLVAFLIVVIVGLIIYYYDRMRKWCKQKITVHSEVSIETDKTPQVNVETDKL